MTDTLKWGFICTAEINGMLMSPLRESRRAELVAVSSRDAMRAQAYADSWGIPRAYGSYDELLADPGVDVVYNALPNNMHAEWTVQAAEAGKHVLCEKPLALSVDEVDRIVEAATKHDVVVQEGFMYRYHPQMHNVLELVRNGTIGDVRLIRGSFSFTLASDDDFRLRPEMGGGALWDVGCYPVSFARAVVGQPPTVVCGQQVAGATDVDMTFVGQMRFPDGTLAQFDCSFETQFGWKAEVVGTDGTIVLDNPWRPGVGMPASIRVNRGMSDDFIDVEHVNAYACEVEALNACVLDGAEPGMPLAESRDVVATIEALYRSARTGAAVPFD